MFRNFKKKTINVNSKGFKFRVRDINSFGIYYGITNNCVFYITTSTFLDGVKNFTIENFNEKQAFNILKAFTEFINSDFLFIDIIKPNNTDAVNISYFRG